MAGHAAARYPFSAIVGQEELKLALLVNAVDPRVGGVLVRGQKGTAKTTAVRALASLLPPIDVVAGCPYRCDPQTPTACCPVCSEAEADRGRSVVPAPFVDLPLSATEDRLIGALDLERVLATGVRAFQPGLLAEANRGVLYVDEVNLLDDHLVDTLLDVAVAGVNTVEREGISVSHPSRFVLVGTMNPEEGEVRPQLLDRFGLSVDVMGLSDPSQRVEIVRRRDEFEADPEAFVERFAAAEDELRAEIARARADVATVVVLDSILHDIAALALRAGVDGHRADQVIVRAARSVAALEGRDAVDRDDVARVAPFALAHRMRRGPLQDAEAMFEAARTLVSSTLGSEGDPESVDSAGTSRSGQGAEPSEAIAETRDASGQAPQSGEPDRDRAPVEARALRTGRTATTRTSGARGRFVTSEDRSPASAGEVALEASVRAAAVRQGGSNAEELAVRVEPADLKRAVRSRRTGATIVFAVDASGSMGAASRMEAAKAAVIELLGEAYRRRDRVGMITFRGDRAETLLTPTASVELANLRLRHISTGGATPLAAGMLSALELLKTETRRDPDAVPWLVLVTDGRANVGLEGGVGSEDARAAASRVRVSGIRTLLLDTARGGSGAAREIADLAGAEYVLLTGGTAGSVSSVVLEHIDQH